MALDTKQKKGSAIGLTLPWRNWLAEPVATIGDGEKLSLLKLCSDVTLETGPSVPGVEYALSGKRSHWRADAARSHFALSGKRLHYVVTEETQE